MKKCLLAIAVIFVLSVPAFADSSFFTGPPFEFTNSYVSFSFSNVNSSEPVYYYLQYFPSNHDTVSVNIISEYLDASTSAFITYSDNSTATRTYSTGNIFGDYFNNPVTSATSATFNPDISIFPSSAASSEIQEAFADFLANSPSPDPTLPTSFSVPRGNVLYFQVLSNSDVNFVSHFSENSGLFSSGNVYGPWGDTYQRISAEASLPGPGIEFPRSGSDAIVWSKGEPLNVLGQTKVGVFTKSCSAGTYYAFYNPAYQSISGSDGFGSTSVGSNVTVSGNFSFIRIYSLQQLLDISTSTDNYDTYFVGTPDGNGGVTWVDQDNQVDYPSSGGENQEDEPISSVSLIESIKRILRNILSEIESIFTFGFSAIRDLVDLMDEFVATFDDLYEWLPEECYTLLIACVSVAIVIGVFKVFL